MIAHAKAAGRRNISPVLFALDVGVGDPATPHTLCDTDEQVLRSVGLVLGASVGDLAKELAQACGYETPATSIFRVNQLDDSATAVAAVADWASLLAKSKVEFFESPEDWQEAANRMHVVIQAARRAGAGDAPGKTAASAVDDGDKVGLFKPVMAAPKTEKVFSVAGSLITPITEMAFARSERVANHETDAVREVRRLVDLPAPVGGACRGFIFSDGNVRGALPKGAVATVVDAREALRTVVLNFIRGVVCEKRLDLVSEKVDRLATAVICVQAFDKDGKMDEAYGLYPLAVFLLGGTPPAEDEDATDADMTAMGTWGTRVGIQSRVDIPAAMAHLARLLAVVHGRAGGGPLVARGPSVGFALLDGFGLEALAKRATSILVDAKVEETMAHLFRRAQSVAARMRAEAGAPPLDWAELVSTTRSAKIQPLLLELRSERAATRIFEERGAAAPAPAPTTGRKSPVGDGAGEGSNKKKKTDFVEQQKLGRAEKKEKKAAAKLQTEQQKAGAPDTAALANAAANAAASVAALALTAPAGAIAGGKFTLAPGSISKLACKHNHDGAIEALSELFRARNPGRQREQEPCPFVGIRKGPDSDEVCRDGATAGGCAQCDGWKSTPPAQRVRFLASEIAAVKAACVSKLQSIFA